MNVSFARAATSEAVPVSENTEQGDNDTVASIPALTPASQSSARHGDENGSNWDINHPNDSADVLPEPEPSKAAFNSSTETPELNDAGKAISTNASVEHKLAQTETPTDTCGDGKPAVKEKRHRKRLSPKRDIEDTFWVTMGMLPHSQNTDDMREMLRQSFDMLGSAQRIEFGQCLHSSIPDSWRYLRWQGFGQVVININFEKLPRRRCTI